MSIVFSVWEFSDMHVVPAPFKKITARSTPPPPHSRHAWTLTPSLCRWAAARVCFSRRCCKSVIKGILRYVKMPTTDHSTVITYWLSTKFFNNDNPQKKISRTRITQPQIFGRKATKKDGYHGTLIGNHGCRIGWDNFRWPWVTPNPGFKVTVYFQVEYLKNGAI